MRLAKHGGKGRSAVSPCLKIDGVQVVCKLASRGGSRAIRSRILSNYRATFGHDWSRLLEETGFGSNQARCGLVVVGLAAWADKQDSVVSGTRIGKTPQIRYASSLPTVHFLSCSRAKS